MLRLSVIVPCYNVEAFIPETIQSLRRASHPDIEFLFIDDKSTDRTSELLEELAPSLPGTRLLHNSENRGLSGARNVGIDASQGSYLAFLDADDFVAAGYYEQLLAQIERLGCDLVRTDHVQVRGRRRSVHRIPYGPRGVVSSPRRAILPGDRMTSVDSPYCWAGIYSRRLVDRGLLHFNESLRTCEDRPWNWRLHLGAESFAVIGLAGLFYRRDVPASLTQTSGTRQFDFLKAFDQIVADVLSDRDVEALLPKALRSYVAMICHHLKRVETAERATTSQGGFTYDAETGTTLRSLCAEALGALPQAELRAMLVTLDEPRRSVVHRLLESAR
ncbi:MAG: glycosyltransferase family 2 protein [Propionibacteriaceae bacterium]|nr:glycosyltransferase family 2 protein [Propionibacteriaceae bacterium]